MPKAQPSTNARMPCELRQVHDGDTYTLLVNWKKKKSWVDATVVNVRLRDYSCPELKQDGGPEAKFAAFQILGTAKFIEIEEYGTNSLGRDVCWVWVDGQSLGQKLVDSGHARPGAFMG